jgi:hypothetical protein
LANLDRGWFRIPGCSGNGGTNMVETSRNSIQMLATRWLAAERQAAERPEARAVADATGLGEAYEEALTDASQEELLLAWESARRGQSTFEIGSAAWAEARRVSELLRVEYRARARS